MVSSFCSIHVCKWDDSVAHLQTAHGLDQERRLWEWDPIRQQRGGAPDRPVGLVRELWLCPAADSYCSHTAKPGQCCSVVAPVCWVMVLGLIQCKWNWGNLERCMCSPLVQRVHNAGSTVRFIHCCLVQQCSGLMKSRYIQCSLWHVAIDAEVCQTEWGLSEARYHAGSREDLYSSLVQTHWVMLTFLVPHRAAWAMGSCSPTSGLMWCSLLKRQTTKCTGPWKTHCHAWVSA